MALWRSFYCAWLVNVLYFQFNNISFMKYDGFGKPIKQMNVWGM